MSRRYESADRSPENQAVIDSMFEGGMHVWKGRRRD